MDIKLKRPQYRLVAIKAGSLLLDFKARLQILELSKADGSLIQGVESLVAGLQKLDSETLIRIENELQDCRFYEAGSNKLIAEIHWETLPPGLG